MAFNDALLNAGVGAMQSAAPFLAIHTAVPDATGSNQSAAARVAAAWPAAANGDFGTLTNKAFTGGAASGAATHLGFWSASTAGTFYGWYALTGDQTFNSAGEYTLVSFTAPGTAS